MSGERIDRFDVFRLADDRIGYVRVRLKRERKLARKLAVLADGTITSVENAEGEFVQEHRAEWGPIDLGLARELLRRSQDAELAAEPFGVGVQVDAEQLGADVAERLLASYHRGAGEMTSPLGGVYELTVGASDVRALAATPGIVSVWTSEPRERFSLGTRDGTAASYTHSWIFWNQIDPYSKFGTGVRVGLSDSVGPDCGIWEEHEAFVNLGDNGAFPRVVYQDPPATCSDDSDCADCEGVGGTRLFESGYCRSGQCIHPHSTAVASRIAHSEDAEPFHAAKASFYVANEGHVRLDREARYEWFVEEDVHLVNESLGFGTDRTIEDWISDFYARNYEILIVRAAGNSEEGDEVECQGLNALCVGSTDSSGTYYGTAPFLDDTISSFSSWANRSDSGTPVDAERPDVVTEGGSRAVIADYGECIGCYNYPTTQWATHPIGGTSVAAPVVTGVVALIEECANFLDEPAGAAQLRAMIKNGAYVEHTLESGPIYPYSGDGVDQKAGVGIVEARYPRYVCNVTAGDPTEPGGEPGGDPNPPYHGRGTLIITDLDDPGQSSPVNTPEHGYMASSTGDSSTHIDNSEYGAMADAYEWHVSGLKASLQNARFIDLEVLPPIVHESGGRVRVTFSYYTCPGRGVIPGPLKPEVDFDIGLCSDSRQDCLIFSESFDDTNEGFDVEVPASFANLDDLTLRVFFDAEDDGCQRYECAQNRDGVRYDGEGECSPLVQDPVEREKGAYSMFVWGHR